MGATIGHCVPSYQKYGKGFFCYIVGLPTFFARNMKIAKEYFKGHGVEMVRC